MQWVFAVSKLLCPCNRREDVVFVLKLYFLQWIYNGESVTLANQNIDANLAPAVIVIHSIMGKLN